MLPSMVSDNALDSFCEKGTLLQRALRIWRQCVIEASRLIDHLQRRDQRLRKGYATAKGQQPLEATRHQGLLPDVITYWREGL